MNTFKLVMVASIAFISGCHKAPIAAKPKLYDNAVVVVKTDKAIVNLSGENDTKAMMNLVQTRLAEYTVDELIAQGDMKAILQCQPRTLRIIQDVESVSSASSWSVSRGWNRGSFSKNADVKVSISTTIEDCESGNRFQKFTYENNEPDLLSVIRTLASWNVGVAYRYQR